MPKFESPLGSKQIQGSGFREIEIPDESGYGDLREEEIVNPLFKRSSITAPPKEEVSDLEKEFKAARELKKAKLQGKERLNEGAKRRLEILLNMTKMTKEVDIGGNIFVLKALSSRETRESLSVASEFDGTVHFAFELRRNLLVRAITDVAGVSFEQLVGTDDLAAKLEFLDEFGEQILNRLYKEYLALEESSKDKYGLKTEQDVKVVFEDLKK